MAQKKVNLLTDCTKVKLSDCANLNSFDCEDADLNEFFKTDSHFYDSQLLGKSYSFVLDGKDEHMVCAFTISNDTLLLENVPKGSRKQVREGMPDPKKRIKSYPAVKIGRLGVNSIYGGCGVGSQLLNFLKAWFADSDNKTGCRFLTVDAYNTEKAISFYKKNDFKFLIPDQKVELDNFNSKRRKAAEELKTRFMYFDLIQITDN